MPNLSHPHCDTMIKIEQYQGRSHPEKVPTQEEFVKVLYGAFEIEKIDNSGAMTKYFVLNR